MSGNDKRKIPGGIGSAALINLSGLIIGTVEDFVNCPTVLCLMARSNHAPLAPTCRQGGAPFQNCSSLQRQACARGGAISLIRTSSAQAQILLERFTTENTVQAQPQPVTKPQMNTEQLSRNQKKISPRTREDASWERTHLACSVNREAVSTLEACAGGRTKILSKKQRILRLVIASRPHTAEGREPPMHADPRR